jgi:phosphoglycolate phosphatase
LILKSLVIFDLDGTIVDSEDFIVWSFVEAGRRVGVRVDPDLVRGFIGYPLDEVVSRVLGSGLSPGVVEEFLSVRRSLIREHWRSRVRLFPDVIPALSELRSMGFKLAVASSSVLGRIVEFLEYLGVIEYFQYISGVEPGVRGKPYSDVITRVLEGLRVDPAEAVYVGDRLVDCTASRSAGVDFILVDRSGREKPLDCTPIETVRSLIEIPRVLKRY